MLEIAEPGKGEDGEEAREVPLLDADPGEWMAYVLSETGRGSGTTPQRG